LGMFNMIDYLFWPGCYQGQLGFNPTIDKWYGFKL